MSKQSGHLLRNFKRALVVLSWFDIDPFPDVKWYRDFGLAFAAGIPALSPLSVVAVFLFFFLHSATFLFNPFTIITHKRDPSPNKDLILISIP